MERRSGAVWLIGGMVLVPYATVLLPFQFALRVQAALIVAALAVAAWGGWRAPREPGRLLPGPVRVGLGVYGAAAVWGAAVGVFTGNPVRFVTSQFLSMALLPAAALAFAVRRDLDGDTFIRGLARAAIAALVLHVAVLVAPQLAGDVPGHFGFDLRNSVGAAGVAPLIWVLGLAWVRAGSRAWSMAVPGAAAILCLWGQSRGAWVSAFIGSVALLLLMARRPGRAVALASVMVLVAVAVAVVTGALVTGSDGRPGAARPAIGGTQLRIASSAATETVQETAPAQAFDGAALQISVRSNGDRGAHLWVWAEFADEAGRPLTRRWVEVVGAGRWTRWVALVAAPPAARSVRAGLWLDRNQGTWLVDGADLFVVRSQLEGLGRQLLVRASSLGHALVDPAADGALSYRMAEARAVHALWSRAGFARRLAGFGLGATFAFPNASFDGEGRRIVVPRASYIHDFYLFLLFKLGLVGAAALMGLVLIVGWTARSAVALHGRPERQWLLAGATAGWVAYLVWGVTSPEIYDFRFAPLWGALVVACCREVGAGNATSAGAGAPRETGSRRAVLAVERLHSDGAFSSLRPEWDALLAGSRCGTVALTWAWLSAWWDLFRDGGQLALLAVRDPSGSLVGLAPFVARSVQRTRASHAQRLEFLGTGEPQRDAICSEYLDVISRREEEGEVVDAIADHLARTWRSGWDEIVMSSTRPGSVAVGLASAMAGRGFRNASFETERCPTILLPEDEEAVPALLSPLMRRKLAYYIRKLEAAGRVELIACRSEADLEIGMDRLVALHQKRWVDRNQRGCFASERFTAFHRRIAPILLREGRLALYSLTVGGTVVYALYGFRDATTLLGYQWGFDPAFDPKVSVGLVMLHHCLRQAVSEGVLEWDFLRGEEPYKAHWATGSHPILELHIWNTTPIAAISRQALLARLAAKRTLRRWRLRGNRQLR